MEQSLNLIEQDINLYWKDRKKQFSHVTGVREVKVVTKDRTFTMLIDERFNDIDFMYKEEITNPFSFRDRSSDFLKEKYSQLLNSDFRYKKGKEFDSSKSLMLDDFINFLKIENRNSTLEKILQ